MKTLISEFIWAATKPIKARCLPFFFFLLLMETNCDDKQDMDGSTKGFVMRVCVCVLTDALVN